MKTTKEITVTTCDVCGEDTKDFYYWESVNTPYGPLAEYTLLADVCKSCMDVIRFDIPESMKKERYDNLVIPVDFDFIIQSWKNQVLENNCKY